jgi:hypothetical protein
MNYPRIAMSAIAGMIVFFICGGLIFGMLIAPDYAPFTNVYRPQNAMQSHMLIGIVSSFIAILVMAIMYAKGYEGRSGLREGARFGLLVGIFVACKCAAENYVTLNISGKLALEMGVGVLVEMAIVGVVIGLVYKPTSGSAVV